MRGDIGLIVAYIIALITVVWVFYFCFSLVEREHQERQEAHDAAE
jgi:hypothetical protein